jgi:hypothetical protein
MRDVRLSKGVRCNVCECILTHFKWEEDTAMESGKFDNQLRSMDAVADHLIPNALVLFNASFAATNEREGSEIAHRSSVRSRIRALKSSSSATSTSLHASSTRSSGQTHLFLRAERQPDGNRTFRLNDGAPLPTSFGQDPYQRIFAPAVAD